MRAISLFGVLVLAKGLTLLGRDVPLSVWTPLAYFWQDACVALLFGAIDRVLGRPVIARVLYTAIVIYAAINVPVTLVLASPLTVSMLRAARGPLADSLAYHLTWVTVGSMIAVLVAGAVLPAIVKRASPRVARVIVAMAVVLAVGGPFAVTRVDTNGLHRNAFGALAGVRAPDAVEGASGDWRQSPDGGPDVQDLTSLRGIARGRHVLLIALESTGARYLGAYGAADDPMPTLTAIAKTGLVFNDAYAVYPESIKGLFSTLCSRYPAFGTSPEAHAAAPCDALPARLAGEGYRTALFHSGRFMYLGMEAIIARQGFDTREDAGAIGGNVHSSFGVDEPATVARMLQWIDTVPRGQRFFMTYLPAAGHHPYATTGPGPFADSTEFGRYRNALHEGDAALASLLQGLRDRHLDRDTLIVIYGDHGEAFGQHPGNAGHTLFIYDENIRVPLVISAPGALTSESRVTRVASLIDIAPTVLDLLGLPRRAAHEGASLLEPRPRMALFFTDYSLGWLGLRDGCLKFIHQLDADRSRLFDVCRDPDETADIGGAMPGRVSGYRDRVKQWTATVRQAMAAPR
jgi:hypothetical protein